MGGPVYQLTNIRKTRGRGRDAYSFLVPSLTVEPGEKILITGPSGCGKSTLLDMLGLILRPDSADDFIFRPDPDLGRNIAWIWNSGGTEALTLHRRHIGYVLQTGGLLPFLRVRDNIEIPRRLLGLPDDGFLNDLSRLMDLNFLDKFPGQISVGERQRAAIARALLTRPPVILADEPTAALDPGAAEAVLDLFVGLVKTYDLTLILVTHAPEAFSGLGFRHLTISRPSVGPAGSREAVLSS